MTKTEKKEPPVKAYSVQETCEGTGGIIFARYSIVARRNGAGIYGDGDFHSVTCVRAAWADTFAERGAVPASAAIRMGWWFECHGCGRRIAEDLPGAWENELKLGEAPNGEQLRYARWKPEHVIGDMDTAIFCRRSCQDFHLAHEAERRRRQDRAIEAFKRLVQKRFPDATFPQTPDDSAPPYRRAHHAYAEKRNGQWRLKQISVSFIFPGMKIAPASLEYRWESDRDRRHRMPKYNCCNGDRETFETWAAGGVA